MELLNTRETEPRVQTNALELLIAKLYVLSLPFRLFAQLDFFQGIFGACATYLPFLFHLLGMFLWVINERGKIRISGKQNSILIRNCTLLVMWFHISSLIMACVIQSLYGNHGSENAFQGIVGMIVYFTQYLLIFVYNIRVFQLLTVETLQKLLHIACLELLGIAYFQVLVMNQIGVGIYDSMNIFGILNSSDVLPKLCLTGSEGATAGCILGILVFPFLFSQIIKGKKKYWIEILLWLVPLYYTYSSTGYILAAVNLLVFLVIFLKENRPADTKRLVRRLVFGTAGTVLIMVGVYLFIRMNPEIVKDIEYILLDKAVDMENGSTVSRRVPLAINWGAFTEFPIIGVGNGLQGYFYEKYIPSYVFSTAGSDAKNFFEMSKNGIANGGVFIPSLLSGYGIVGCLLILAFVVRCIKGNKAIKDRTDNFYYMYLIGGIAFIVGGFQGDMTGNYFAWFVLSIPFMSMIQHRKGQKTE